MLPQAEETDTVWVDVPRYVGTHLSDFVQAGRRLDGRFSESAHGARLEEERREGLDGTPEGSSVHAEFRKPIDTTQLLPMSRLAAAIVELKQIVERWRSALLVTEVTQEQAEEILLITYLLLEADADKKKPTTCEFQALPWKGTAKGWQCRNLLAGHLYDPNHPDPAWLALVKVATVKIPVKAGPKGGRGRKGEEQWREAKDALLEKLDKKALPTGFTIEEAGRLIGYKESTTRTAIHNSPSLLKHFNLGRRDESTSLEKEDDLFEDLSVFLKATFDCQESSVQSDLRKMSDNGEHDKVIEMLQAIGHDPKTGRTGVARVGNGAIDPSTDGTLQSSRKKCKPLPTWGDDQD